MNYESLAYKTFKLFNFGFMLMVIAVMLFPYLNVLAIALNDGLDSQLGGITVYPRKFTLDNFRTLIGNNDVIHALYISITRVIVGTVFAVIVQFSCAYAFMHKGLRWKNAILIFLMIPMFFGGGLIPVYLLYAKMHLLNNFLVYILPVTFSLYNMVIIRSYLYTIPESLGESAKLDGANDLVVLLRIYMPLSMPILAVIALWTAVNHWNDWTSTLYFVTNRDLFTLQYVLMQVLREGERVAKLVQDALQSGLPIDRPKLTPQSLIAAQIILTTIPIVVVYPFLQKYFVKGITLGAVKE